MILNEEFLRQRQSKVLAHYDNREERILNENKQLYIKSNKYDLFISHSYLDRDLIINLVELFNELGYCVYVDWINDPELDRSKVNKKTAELLRSRMDVSKGLAYIATNNIPNSKWCPWELGYADGKKGGKCAILPIMKTKSDCFKGQEYLELYPYISYIRYADRDAFDFWVNVPNGRSMYTTLRTWLNKNTNGA